MASSGLRAGLLAEILTMAVDTLRTNKLRSFLTILGVVIGITSIVSVTALLRGFDESFKDMFRQIGPTTMFVAKFSFVSRSQGKTFRDLIAGANATLMTDQAPVDVASWDAIQEVSDDALSAIVFAFKGSPEPGRWIARPHGLVADATYDVTSIDIGALGSARGDALMQDGIEIVHDGGSRAHILLLKAR